MENVLEIEHLSLSLPSKKGMIPILHDVNLEVGEGKIMGLVGESGSGKSMTAFAVTRLLPGGGKAELDGSIRLCGRQLLGLGRKSMEEVRGRDVSMIFQEPMTCLNPVFTIGTQMTDVIRTHEKISKEEAFKKAVSLLEEVHIRNAEDVISCYPYELSGGMRQRVMIAIALSCHPKLLIADEPTTALDVTVQAQILYLIKEACRNLKTAVLFISHDLGVISEICDSISVMYSGHIVESGDTASVLTEPCHPYTRALIGALPKFTREKTKERLTAIPGMVPDPSEKWQAAASHPAARGPPPPAGKACRRLWKSQKAIPYTAAIPRRCDMDILEIKNVTKTFHTRSFWGKSKEVHALNGITLSLAKGESLGIVGESGCGKSTLASLIIHLAEPTSGEILLYEKDISHAKEKEVKEIRKKIQIVFQDPYSSLSPRMKIGDIIMEPARVMGEFSEAHRKERAEMLLEMVGLRKNVMDRYPHEFSGGQRQRISIARALMTSPEILILDEPTSALDVSVQAQVLNILMDLREKLHLTYLFISHNLAVVRYISDRTAVMQKGKIVEMGPSDEILCHPRDPYTKELIAAVPMIGKPFAAPARITELG